MARPVTAPPVRFLNYGRELAADTVGEVFGPDLAGRVWRCSALLERTDAKPGTRMQVYQLNWHPETDS